MIFICYIQKYNQRAYPEHSPANIYSYQYQKSKSVKCRDTMEEDQQ